VSKKGKREKKKKLRRNSETIRRGIRAEKREKEGKEKKPEAKLRRGVGGVTLLVYAALSYYCMRP
jgi:hypothetical protein